MPKYVGVQTNAMKLLIYKICASLRPIRREDDTSAKCCHHEIKLFVQADVFLAMIFGKHTAQYFIIRQREQQVKDDLSDLREV